MTRLWLLLALAGLMSCSPSEKHTEIYSVLHDITDDLQAKPKAEVLWQFVGGDNINKHLYIRYSTLSDVDINEVYRLERQAKQTGLMANEVQEKKRADTFKQEFNTFFEQTDSIGQSHSAIFKPILAELEYLSHKATTSATHLIVYSNLMENSDWLSFYKSEDVWHLYHNTEVIVERYMAQVSDHTNYQGIAVHIIYQPTDFKDNIRFKQLRMVYTAVFKQLGIPIYFSANLTSANKDL